MILKEGGNIFKDPESKEPLTQRIRRDDVDPTLAWVEKITGLPHRDFKLGSTGKKATSGDLDVAVDQNEVSKDEMVARLMKWVEKNHPDDAPRQWVAKSGTNVHFRTPINGNPENGYVQTDLMFGDPNWMKFALKGSGDDTVYGGKHRMIMIASIAKAQGMKWSPTSGLVDRASNTPISKDPEEIANRLLGPGATKQTLDSVESINSFIKTKPNYAELTADARDYFEKEGLPMPESRGIFKGMKLAEKKKGTHGKACWDGYRRGEGNSCIKVKKRTENSKPITKSKVVMKEGARIDHLEDLIFFEGSAGAVRALESLKNLEKGGHENVTLKWDGSPAVIFGRDENGEFIFTDKGGFGKKDGAGRAKSGDELKAELLNRSGGKNKDDPGRIEFANSMAQIFDVYEKATPKDYRGFLKGDLLYKTTPQVKNNEYIFKPQLVEYRVDTNSDIGKKIGASTSGIVIHREVDANGSESALKDNPLQGNSVLVFPPVYVQKAPQVDNAPIIRLAKIIQKDKADINSLFDQNKLAQKGVTKNFNKLLYTYTNSKVDTGLDNMGKDFMRWLDTAKISQKMKTKVAEYIKENIKAFRSLWEVHTGIMKAKDEVIRNMDQQGDLPVKQYINGKPGGEGYVLAHPEGDVKFVNRAEFTAANRAVER